MPEFTTDYSSNSIIFLQNLCEKLNDPSDKSNKHATTKLHTKVASSLTYLDWNESHTNL